MKYIFVSGGVTSSLGKGITCSSIGLLLKSRGLKVTILKFDPYLNVDPGTMNPYQHGEVFVTNDSAETDLDLGHYERFLNVNMTRANNVTAGQIYDAIISKERKGDYLGKTVQVIPHVTDEIKSRIKLVSKGHNIVIVEIGGTVGDIESLPFLEAIRQMKLDYGKENVIYIHVTFIPYIKASDELKTKPTQHSVNKLREIGIDPDIIICRTEKPLNDEIKSKISLFCNVPKDSVLEAPDVECTYEIPLILEKQNLDEILLHLFHIRGKKHDLDKWRNLVNEVKKLNETVNIGICGKYTGLKDAYKSLSEAIFHGGLYNKLKVNIDYFNVEETQSFSNLKNYDGIIVPGGFGERGIEGKIRCIKFARENAVPFLGICLGMQCAVIEYARNVLHLQNANSTEFDKSTPYPVIDILPSQKNVDKKGGTMRLGVYKSVLKKATLAEKIYKKSEIFERHRHRYEFNNEFRKNFENTDFVISGEYHSPNGENLVEIIELKNHPWFIGVQFHPEFNSTLERPNRLFNSFINACIKNKKEKKLL